SQEQRVLVPANATDEHPGPPAWGHVVPSQPLSRGGRTDGRADDLTALRIPLWCRIARVPGLFGQVAVRRRLLEIGDFSLHPESRSGGAERARPFESHRIAERVIGADQQLAHRARQLTACPFRVHCEAVGREYPAAE